MSANTGDLSVRYGGGKESNTSRLIDHLRALYDADLAERRDNIEQLARDPFGSVIRSPSLSYMCLLVTSTQRSRWCPA